MTTHRGLITAVLGILLWSVGPGVAYAAAGRIVFAIGQVAVRDAGGQARAAMRGTRIDAGQTVITRQGRAQIRFTDGGQISLIPNTVFRVDGYEYRGRPDGSESALLRLVRGGLRAVTGVIGRARKSAYRLRTPVATIGIRGTSYQARFCEGDCPGRADGLYVQGGTGTVFVENEGGTLDVTGGRTVFVARVDMPPAFTTVEPDVAAPGRAVVAAVAAASSASTDAPELNSGQLALNSIRDDADDLLDVAARVVRTIAPRSGGFAVAGETFQTSLTKEDGTLIGGDGIIEAGSAAGASGLFDSDDRLTVGLNASDGIVQLVGSDLSEGDSAVVSISNVEDAGSDGILFWGRWANATATIVVTTNAGPQSDTIALTDPTSIHYIVGQPAAVIPGGGIATYDFFDGTRSTSATLVGAGVTSGRLTANFGTRNVSALMTVSHGTNFLVNVPSMLIENSGSFDGSGTATGGCASCPVEMDGFFAGTGGAAPPRAGVAYRIENPGDAINGAAAFRCTSSNGASGC